jgi:hypothetical protein
MKKSSFSLVVMLLLANILPAQAPQRLAVIPGMGENIFRTICIDFFADIPAKGQSLDKVMALSPSYETEAEAIAQNHKFIGTNKYSEIEFSKNKDVSISHPFIIGTSDAENAISANYSSFIENRIKHFKSLGLDATHLRALQDQVWEYDALHRLGYLHETGQPMDDYNTAISRFTNEFGSKNTEWGESRILSVAEGIKSVDLAGGGNFNNARFLFVSKNVSTGEFIVFDRLAGPIYRGTDKAALIRYVNSSYKEGDNVYIQFDETMTVNNRKAFLTDIEIRFRTIENKSLAVSEFNDILFSDKLTHSLIPGDDKIIPVRLRGQDYYEADLQVKSEIENKPFAEFTSTVTAFSTQRNVVASFVSYFKNGLSSYLRKRAIAGFLFSTKRSVENTMGISRKDLILLFNTEGRASIITEKPSHNQIFVAKN